MYTYTHTYTHCIGYNHPSIAHHARSVTRRDKCHGEFGPPFILFLDDLGDIITMKWVWVNTYRYIFSGMNIHLPAILMFTRGTRF